MSEAALVDLKQAIGMAYGQGVQLTIEPAKLDI